MTIFSCTIMHMASRGALLGSTYCIFMKISRPYLLCLWICHLSKVTSCVTFCFYSTFMLLNCSKKAICCVFFWGPNMKAMKIPYLFQKPTKYLFFVMPVVHFISFLSGTRVGHHLDWWTHLGPLFSRPEQPWQGQVKQQQHVTHFYILCHSDVKIYVHPLVCYFIANVKSKV